MHILKELLETGHRVRVISRSQEKGKVLQDQFSKQADQIDVVDIQDQLAPGAYDEAVKGVDAIIHTASPFTLDVEDVEKELLQPAEKMATNMLKAAAQAPSVKRIVLTSSVAAVADPFNGGLFAETTYTSESWNPIKRDQAEGGNLGYLASKTIAEHAAWDFVKKEKPQFDLVTVCPTLILGEPIQHVKSMNKLNTSCANIYALFDTKEIPDNEFPCIVSVHDVARAHVQGVDVAEAGGKRFILNGDSFSNQLTIDAIREKYPEMRDRMMVGKPGQSEVTKKPTPMDVSPAEKILGIKFAKTHEIIMEQTVPALIALEKKLKK